jgi:hypothetical protein
MVRTSESYRKSRYEHRAKNLYPLSSVMIIFLFKAILYRYQFEILCAIYSIFKNRQIFCLLDEWCDMSMEDIRKFEEKVKEELDKVYFRLKFFKT